MKLLFGLALTSSWLLFSDAFSSGAAACPAKRAAPPLGHGPGQETSLAERSFEFTVEGPLVVGEAATITLTANDERIPFRGFLLRLTSGDGVVEPVGPQVQTAGACGDVPGVTQTSSASKSFIEATVVPMVAGPMVFDVSVVEFNNAVNGNVYSYDSFEFQVAPFLETDEPTMNPVTSIPTASPTAQEETDEPTTTPTTRPTVSPSTASPSVSPTGSPTTASPTGLPTESPSTLSPATASPTAQLETDEPTTVLTIRPTVSPSTASPSVSPTDLPTTASPTVLLTESPSTVSPITASSSSSPIGLPTESPPTVSPTSSPTTASPTISPSTASPSVSPTGLPTTSPTDGHVSSSTMVSTTQAPTAAATIFPSTSPSIIQSLDLTTAGNRAAIVLIPGIQSGTVIDLASTGSKLSILARINPMAENVSTVTFEYDRDTWWEGWAPYAMRGNEGNRNNPVDYLSTVGPKFLRVSARDASSSVLESVSYTFTVVNSGQPSRLRNRSMGRGGARYGRRSRYPR